MLNKQNILSLFLLCIIALGANSQDISNKSLVEAEDSLTNLMKIIYNDNPFSTKEEANNKFNSLLRTTLAQKGAFDYPFDSLKHIGKIKSEDKKVRIFTWDLPQSGGDPKYFGFILLKKSKEDIQIFDLIDSRKSILDPIKEILDNKKWIGSLYYSIIDVSYKGRTYYILLGFDFNNIFSSKKVIEVLTFGKNSEPIFGSSIFKVDDEIINRIVFEFSARASMTLRYIADSKTIIFDHLSPSQPDFSGIYQFYGPDFSFDGFKFEKGYWVYLRNLDIRNPKRVIVKPKESPDKLPEPSFLYKSKKK